MNFLFFLPSVFSLAIYPSVCYKVNRSASRVTVQLPTQLFLSYRDPINKRLDFFLLTYRHPLRYKIYSHWRSRSVVHQTSGVITASNCWSGGGVRLPRPHHTPPTPFFHHSFQPRKDGVKILCIPKSSRYMQRSHTNVHYFQEPKATSCPTRIEFTIFAGSLFGSAGDPQL